MTQFPGDSRVPVSTNRKGGTVNSTAKAVIAGATILMAMTGPATAQTPVLIGFNEGEAELAVRRAVEGAGARLGQSECREVLSDFTDDAGQSLDRKLLASGRSPAQALALLRFFDDRAAAEIIVIHEFLHALGLGENPPTSDEITERVTARCGGGR
jgi:hypothetical protein